jgi:hypothetical protein
MKFTNLTMFLILALFLNACTFSIGNREVIHGSGVSASETRSVSGFTGVEIAGSADVTIDFGETESIVVETDDNLLPYLETKVSSGSLVINTKPNTDLNTDLGIRVHVTMIKLEKARITGSGNMNITGIQADTMKFDLPGSGNITASGVADNVTLNLSGSGNIYCSEVQAGVATVQLNGSGNITVYASESLKATISGSGSVRYRGNPGKLEQSVPGSGSITAMP